MIRALPWDSDFFGFPIGTVEGSTNAHELQGFECVYWLADEGDEAPAALGFAKVDERITLEFVSPKRERRGPTAIPDSAPSLALRANKTVPPALIHTARMSHTDSRFFQDARFPRERCEDLFQRWLERDFAHNLAWTIGRDGEPAGYITLTANDDCTSIGLLSVVEQHRGHGLAKSLISQALAHSASLGLPCRVVTQGRNTAALKAYTSMGFAIVERRAWWHWWRSHSPALATGADCQSM